MPLIFRSPPPIEKKLNYTHHQENLVSPHIKNGKYVVLTWWCPSHLVEVLSQVCRTKISLWNDNTHTACLLDVQVSRFLKKSDACAILSVYSFSHIVISNDIWYQNWYIVSWPLILTGQWSSYLQLYCAGFFFIIACIYQSNQIGKGVMGVPIRLV